MRTLRLSSMLVVVCLLAVRSDAQTSATPDAWGVSVTVDGYAVPHSKFYVSPVIAADHGWLHLEGRYNYESQRTGSFWVGYNFSAGSKLELQVTPILGAVFGDVTGIAPGCEISLTYRRLELSSTQEYVFDTKDRSGSFFYSWPQLTYSPRDWVHLGIVAQHTKAYHTDLSVQRGILAGFTYKKVTFTTYVFNAGWTKPTVVLELVYSH